jgi:Mce-associated membrane protein
VSAPAHLENSDEKEDDADELADREVADRSDMLRLGLVLGLVVLAALATVSGWLGFQTYRAVQDHKERMLFLDAGRESAVMLTTINADHVDADVKRILDSSTGAFRQDFQSRSGPFVDTVRKVQSRTEGRVVEAGLELVRHDQAAVLVAVSVTTSLGGAEAQPRVWRMRIGIQKVGAGTKVSNVEFVP